MHRSLQLSYGNEEVKANLVSAFEQSLDRLLEEAERDNSIRELEESIWDIIIDVGRQLMSLALSLRCRRVTERDIEARNLSADQLRLRNDADYRITLMTTFGPVEFFSFAYRDLSSGALGVTRTPAREQVFPLHKHCRSSELCLEWETKLGQEMPFRRAQQTLSLFTHGAVSLEDTTIERHMLIISRLIERKWLYQSPEVIRDTLLHRATRDLKTGKPLLYLSSDAHAIRRFVDETWDARWKMANGLRLWCMDRQTGRIIHLGGEYTWGDCHRVGEIVDWLIEADVVPADGDFGEGVVAQIVVPADGMPWFEKHIINKFSDKTVALLDPHHVFEHLRDYADERHGKKSLEAKAFLRKALRLLLGPRREKKGTPRKTRRKAQQSSDAQQNSDAQPVDSPSVLTSWKACELAPNPADVLVDQLMADDDVPEDALNTHQNLIDYFTNNAYRMNYPLYRSRGYQLGSGAMESLHRSGSQVRLKLPGFKALQETSQAIFNLRMLDLGGRWDEFWQQVDFYEQLVDVFSTKPDDSDHAQQKVA